MRLMKGEQDRLQHGWHALGSEPRMEDRSPTSESAQPPIFERQPWNSIPRERFGIESLVNRLEFVLNLRIIKCALEKLEGSF
jgi:hypothetical protein